MIKSFCMFFFVTGVVSLKRFLNQSNLNSLYLLAEENDEYKSRKKHIYKEDRADSIYCPLLFQRRGKGNLAGKD